MNQIDSEKLAGEIYDKVYFPNVFRPEFVRDAAEIIRTYLGGEPEKPLITHTPELDAMRRKLAEVRADGWDEEDTVRFALYGVGGCMDFSDEEVRELYAEHFGDGEEE